MRGAGGEARNTEPGGLWGSGQRGAARTAHDRFPRAGQHSGDRDTRQNKTQAPEAASACRPRPQDPKAGAESPGRWSAPGRPSRTFSVHRRIDCRARSGLVRRVSHLVIHYRGDLSGPRAALSPSQAFVIPTCVLVSLGITVAASTFWDAKALCSSPMKGAEGKKKKERKKKTNKEGVNVQETLLQIQIALGFHSSESLR